MPRVDALLLCDSLQNTNTPDGRALMQIVAPTTILRPMMIPSTFSFGLYVSVKDVNICQMNSLLIEILDNHQNIVFSTGTINLPSEQIVDSKVPEEYRGFDFAIDIRNATIAEAGIFNVKIVLNGELIDQKDVPVFAR